MVERERRKSVRCSKWGHDDYSKGDQTDLFLVAIIVKLRTLLLKSFFPNEGEGDSPPFSLRKLRLGEKVREN